MYRLIIAILLLIFISSKWIHSQLLTQFKASQGISTAIAVVKDSGMTQPELIAVGTFTGTLPMGPVQIDLEYDLDNGKATAWGYFFRSATNRDSIKAIGVISIPLLGYAGMEIPLEDLPDIPASQPDSALPAIWMDSDEMVQNLKKNIDYSDFIKTYPETKLRLLGLGVNNENPMIEMNVPWWSGIYRSDGGIITCWVNSNTGQTICLPVTSAEDIMLAQSEAVIFPNPTSDVLFIAFNDILNISFLRYEFYDNLGNMLKSGSWNNVSMNTSLYQIDISILNIGSYYIKIITDDKIYIKPVLIIR
jgi:hypothetical protein